MYVRVSFSVCAYFVPCDVDCLVLLTDKFSTMRQNNRQTKFQLDSGSALSSSRLTGRKRRRQREREREREMGREVELVRLRKRL